MRVFHYLNLNKETLNWGRHGVFAILDQGFFSTSNFVLNVLLARWLTEVEYGIFSLSFVIYLFIVGFHNAIVLEPMSVLGTGNYSTKLQHYIQSQYKLHFLLTALIGLISLSVTQLLFHLDIISREFYGALIGVGLFSPFMLLVWLVRRIYYILREPHKAFFVSFAYAVCLGFGAVFLQNQVGFNGQLFLVYVLFGSASFIATGWLIFNIRKPDDENFTSDFSLRILLKEQWLFGRWLVLGNIFYFIGTQIQFLFVGFLLSVGESGVYRALQNVMLPMMQVITAISAFSVPIISLEFGNKKYKEMEKKAFRITTALLLLSFFYLLGLVLLPGTIEKILYGGKFNEYIWAFPIFGIIPIILSLEVGFSIINRSLQKPIYHTVLTGSVALAGIISAYFMVQNFGIKGAIFSLISIQVFSLLMNIYLFKKWFINNKIVIV